MTDLVLAGGTLVHETGRERADIAITGETISAIGAPGTLGHAAQVVDVSGHHVVPAPSTRTCISASRATPTRRTGRPARGRPRWAA